MSTGDDKKIIQIMPAEGWRAAYFDDEQNEVFYNEIIAFGLRDDGFVVPIGWDGDESDDTIVKTSNFVGLCPPGKRMPVGFETYVEWIKELKKA